MSYSDPLRIAHSFGPITTSALVTKSIKGPAGKRGRVVAVSTGVSTTIVGNLMCLIGVAGQNTKFATVTIGALTAPNGMTDESMNKASQPLIEASDLVQVQFMNGTAGVIEPTVVIDWF